MPHRRPPPTNTILTSLLAGVGVLLRVAMGLFQNLKPGDKRGLSLIVRMIEKAEARLEIVVWRAACQMADRPDLINADPAMRHRMFREMMGDVADDTDADIDAGRQIDGTLHYNRAIRRFIQHDSDACTRDFARSPRLKAMTALMCSHAGRYAARSTRRWFTAMRKPRAMRFAASSVVRHAARQPDPG